MKKVYKMFINNREKRLRKKTECGILITLPYAVEQLCLSARNGMKRKVAAFLQGISVDNCPNRSDERPDTPPLKNL